MTVRPRFATEIEPFQVRLPVGKKMGGVIAADFSPEGDLIVLHQPNPPGQEILGFDPGGYLANVVRFRADGTFVEAWGGPDHVPAIAGVPQWPAGQEGIECDEEGNIWVFGYYEGDDNVLKFSPSGELLMRLGQRGRRGDDDDTVLLGGPTSCWHDVENREVFVSDGYGNHRVIAFNSDTGEFTRMWGAYGKRPSELSAEEGFGNPVHKVIRGPNGLIYVCDRIKNRIQEFELVPGGVGYLREVRVGIGTMMFGSCFDIAFSQDGRFMYVADGSNLRVWLVALEDLSVLGWVSVDNDTGGEDNLGRVYGILHRFRAMPNGDLLLCCTTKGLRRLKYLGTY
jgi:DNA-binding beta-propeller fold protein YncE